MNSRASKLPVRLRVAAEAVANARAARAGAPAIANVLDVLPDDLFDGLIEELTAAFDAADAASPSSPSPSQAPPDQRISLAATVCLDLSAQAVVLLDVARDGTVAVSTFAPGAGTPSRAIAEWAHGLESHAISVVPFRTVFGWGRGGTPTPLTKEEARTLGVSGRAYAYRNTDYEGAKP